MYNSGSIRISAMFLATAALLAVLVWPAPLYGGTRTVDLSVQDNFNSGNLNAWEMPVSGDWEILKEGNLHYLHMKRSRDPVVPSHPLQFALLKNINVSSFTLNVKVRRAGDSMIVVFNYMDAFHFYYAHLSKDHGGRKAGHNGIFVVDGGSRRQIAGLDAAPALPDRSWHDVQIVRNVHTGSIKVFLDKQARPLFSAADRTFLCGQIGLGSYDEMGDFTYFQLSSNDAQRSAVGKR